MKNKSFILYDDSLDLLDDMTKEQIGELFLAIRNYRLGREVKLDGLMNGIFKIFKNQIDRDSEKYKTFHKKQSNNGKKGGRPKNPTLYLANPKNPTLYLANPKKP